MNKYFFLIFVMCKYNAGDYDTKVWEPWFQATEREREGTSSSERDSLPWGTAEEKSLETVEQRTMKDLREIQDWEDNGMGGVSHNTGLIRARS